MFVLRISGRTTVGEEILEIQEDIIKTIQLNNSEITLIGTAHVSQLSVEMVEEKIATGDYDCVAVELFAAFRKYNQSSVVEESRYLPGL